MKSAVASISDVYNPKVSAEKLLEQIREQVDIGEKSIGIMVADGDCKPDLLSKYLYELSGINIIGSTSVAIIDSMTGYNEMSVSLLVLTGDDIEFTIALSDEYKQNAEVDAAVGAYKKCLAENNGLRPEMAFLMVNYVSGQVTDEIVEGISKISDNVPVFGCLPTAFENKGFIFLNGEIYYDRAIVLTIHGNLKPLFVVKNITSDYFGRKFKATKVEGRVIYEVDNKPFTQYLKNMGVDIASAAKDPNGIFFQSNPIYIERELDNKETLGYTRVIESVDLDKGSATVYSNMQKNATMSITSMRVDNIQTSSLMLGRDMAKLIEENKSEDYTYTSAICVTCYGRFLVAAAQHDIEANTIKQNLPEGLNMVGLYSYGEICPITLNETHNNIVHNCSVTLCVF